MNSTDLKNPVIAKYIATAGVCSRRRAQEFIAQGLVVINGQVVTEPGYRVNPSDRVVVDGQGIKTAVRKLYILLNKPQDCVTTVSDELGRRTVMELIPGVRGRMYPVGRLDRSTTGLLLLTNDGALAQRLSHPSYEVKKVYQVTLKSPVSPDHMTQLVHQGVSLVDGVARADVISYVPKSRNCQVRITLHSGKNRIVRRMFEALGYEVATLDRISFAGLTKYGLRTGAWRYLTRDEVERLSS